MDRRTFIKTAAVASLTPTALANTPTTPEPIEDWSYIVYCYNRKQGEWTFNYVTRGSFASEREYITFEEEPNGYCGFMYDGKLHFMGFDDAADFVWMHVKTYDDTNVLDTIYDIYFKNSEGKEIQVAHYWFNGDTGSQIHWETPGFNTDWNKVECA